MPPECHICGVYWVNGAPSCDCDGRNPKDIIRGHQEQIRALKKVVNAGERLSKAIREGIFSTWSVGLIDKANDFKYALMETINEDK